MPELLSLLLFIAALVAVCNLLADRISVPAPVLLAASGLVLGFVPMFPKITLNPQLVLLLFLPPLVYSAAVQLPWDEFRDNLRPISALAVGLVLLTTFAVAAVAQALVPGLSWIEAFILGAVVAPTDPVAITAVAGKIGVPRRLSAILEGEGLVNDAVALTLLHLAISSNLNWSAGLAEFSATAIGELAWGLFVGWAVALVRARISDARVEVTVSLITPFIAYLLPESLGGSGVLATVTAGMYIGARTPEIAASRTRLHLTGVWDIIVYQLNGFLFLLTGLQFHRLLETRGLVSAAVAVIGTVIATRFAWAWLASRGARMLFPAAGEKSRLPPNRHLTLIAWCGMRGGISLAAALSIPTSFQSREDILFLTALVIGATLLLVGSSVLLLVRVLHLDADAERERDAIRDQEQRARMEAAEAALRTLPADTGNLLRVFYEARAHGIPPRLRRQHRRALVEERRVIRELQRQGRLSEHSLNRLQRALDLEEAGLEEAIEEE